MHNSTISDRDVYSNKLLFIIVIIYSVLGGVILLKTESIALVIMLSIIPLFIFFYNEYLKDIPTLLIIVTVVPFVYLDSSIHTSLSSKIILDVFLFVFSLIAFLSLSLNFKNAKLKISYLMVPIVAITIYSILSAVLGLSRGNSVYWVVDELYNHLYYFMVIPIVYMIKKKKHYRKIIFTIVGATFILALEYIYINITSDIRFVTFQADIFSLSFGICLSWFLFTHDNFVKKSIVTFVGLVIVIGAYYTQTRSLWVAILITLLFILLYYKLILNSEKKIPKKWIYVGLFFLFAVVAFGGVKLFSSSKKQETVVNTTTEEKVESISSPTSDVSFLMRVELGYYMFQRFLINPIWGEGLGGTVQYKVLGNSKIHYSDNSWLYFLWKQGIVGVSLWGVLFYRFFKQSIFILRTTYNRDTKIFVLGIMGGLLGILFISLLTSTLIKYGKINLIYAIIFAYVEFEKMELDKCKNLK